MAELKITLSRSFIGRPQDQIKTAKALGLTRVGRTVIKTKTPAIEGMINKIPHLVTVEEVK